MANRFAVNRSFASSFDPMTLDQEQVDELASGNAITSRKEYFDRFSVIYDLIPDLIAPCMVG